MNPRLFAIAIIASFVTFNVSHADIITCGDHGCSDQITKHQTKSASQSVKRHTKHYEAEPQIMFRMGNSSVVTYAESYVGKTPTVSQLKEWARVTGIGTWRFGVRVYCALGVNKVLHDAGIRGTGSALASSFRSWGRATFNPQPGDVAVFGNYHVAIVTDRRGNEVELVSFNDSGRRILQRTYPVRSLRFRTASL